MPVRWTNPYLVLLTGYLVGTAICVVGMVGVFVYMAVSYGFWPWHGILTALIGTVRSCVMELLAFALLGAAAFAARSLNKEPFVIVVALGRELIKPAAKGGSKQT